MLCQHQTLVPASHASDRGWGGLWSLHEDSGKHLPRPPPGLCARPASAALMGEGRGLGTYVQNVHALPEAVVEGIELHGQVLRHLGRAGRRRLRATTPEGAPCAAPTGATTHAPHSARTHPCRVRDCDGHQRPLAQPLEPRYGRLLLQVQQHLGQLQAHLPTGSKVKMHDRRGPAAPPTPAEARALPADTCPACMLTSRVAAGLLRTRPSRACRAASQRSQSSDAVRAAERPPWPE